MKAFRLVLWSTIFVLGAYLAYQTVTTTLQQGDNVAAVGGPFEGVFTDGTPANEDKLEGRPYAIFFGFTHCPDVCPTTLYEASQWYAALGEDADKVDVYFASVDPARDTKEILADYISAFDERIKGITGTPEQMAEMMRVYRVFAQRVDEEDGDYTMNHTATTFLMDSNNRLQSTIAYGESMETAVAKMKRLADS
ncbi:MAG: SCO family protein [Pseudomonadota bacterium]